MGAVPSRESTSLFSYFRGSYEVGMVPLTKYYFGNDSSTSESADGNNNSNSNNTTGHHQSNSVSGRNGKHGRSSSVPPRDRLRQQLRQQLLLMRRDPAVLYANAREIPNVLDSLLSGEADKEGMSTEGKSKQSAASSPTTATASRNGLSVNISPNRPNSPSMGVESDVRGARTPTSTTAAATAAAPLEGKDAADELRGLGDDIQAATRDDLLRREYWSVMPHDNFSEQDLDHFLELVEETLFETNDEMLAADPIREQKNDGGADAATSATTRRPFLPVPCALCLAYPDGKERDGAFTLDGRVVNIIGYFGLMTPEMQDAFKVVKRVPTSAETSEDAAHDAAKKASGADATPTMYLNTAILTSAGDRTLERVLVLAAVMLRQQFHTVGRRHLLQAKLDQLIKQQPEQLTDADVQMLYYLQTALAIPPTSNAVLGARAVSADGVQLPYFDPILEVPLPRIPRGIYRPTHYINAASTDPPRRQSSMSSLGRASFNASTTENSFVASASATLSAAAAAAAAAATSSLPSGSRTLLYPQGGSLVNGGAATPSAIVVPGSLNGSVARPPLLMPGSMTDSQGGPSGSYPGAMPPPQLAASPAALPLDQAEEDAITLAFCRRMEKIVVRVETASNNYSALKSLTENFAFLHCQILLDENLTHMELIDLPGLAETPSFKPQKSATTPVTTLKAAADTNAGAAPAEDCGNEASDRKSGTRYPLSPNSAVVITLDPALVRQATMWASSFFHCPTRLPTGSWVKYKLKDECDQLRHVLQNKDMLIAHWRKSDADRAARYLGAHTGRLLEHVRALQAETEEARALPADYWAHRPLFVNQDGRKYALFQSRYGTMLIGVRAFSTASNPSSSLTTAERGHALTGGRGGPSNAPTSNPSHSVGGNSGHANSLPVRHGNNNMHVPHHLHGQMGWGEGIGAVHGAPRMPGGHSNHPFFMTGSGTFLPYMAPPPDSRMSGMQAYYAAPPLMVPQGAFAASTTSAAGGEVPHYYANTPMMAMGATTTSASYGSKHSGSMSYAPTSSLTGLPPPPGSMLSRGPPPPPPPPPHLQMHHHQQQQQQHANSGSGAAAAAAMMASGTQFFDPRGFAFSAAMNGSSGSTAGASAPPSLTSVEAAHQASMMGGFSHAPAYYAAPPRPEAAASAAATTNAATSLLSPVPTVTTTATPHDFAARGASSLQSAALWSTSSDPRAHSFSGGLLGSPLGHTADVATAATATEATGLDAALHSSHVGASSVFPVHSIWEVDAAHDATTSEATGLASTSSPRLQASSTSGAGAASLPDRVTPQSLAEHKTSFTTQTTGWKGPLLLQREMNQTTSPGGSTTAAEAADATAAAAQETATTALPWATHKGMVEWASGDDANDAAPHYLLRGTELLDVEDEDGEMDAQRLHLELAAATTAEADLSGTKAKPTATAGTALDPRTPFSRLAAPPTSSGYVPMDPRIPTPPQSLPSGTAMPPVAMDASRHSQPQSFFPYAHQHQQQQHQQPSSQASSSLSSHPAGTLAPNQLLYYTVANGVPMLVQPPTTAGGMAMAFPLSGPVTHGDPTMMPYAGAMPLPPQPQHGHASSPPQGDFGFAAPMGQGASYPNARRGLHNPPTMQNSPPPHTSSGTF